MELPITTRVNGSWTVVQVGGEVDLSSAPQLEECLQTLIARDGQPRLIVDFRPTTFMDCTGLSVLVRVRKQVRVHGDGAVRLVITHPSILNVFRITGLHAVFPIYDSLAGALAVPADPPEFPAGQPRGEQMASHDGTAMVDAA
jgi:anti-sigma B factor antagonist